MRSVFENANSVANPKKKKNVSILRMSILWGRALGVCTGSIPASSVGPAEGNSETPCRRGGIHACAAGGRERFPGAYCVPDAEPPRFPDMSQESCSHPVFTDVKPATLTEKWAKVTDSESTEEARFKPWAASNTHNFSTTPGLPPVMALMTISHIK